MCVDVFGVDVLRKKILDAVLRITETRDQIRSEGAADRRDLFESADKVGDEFGVIELQALRLSPLRLLDRTT